MKKNKFLGIFAIVIFILLILIMFILPDGLFLAIENGTTIPIPMGTETTKEDTITLEDKITKLKTNEYNYEYTLMYSTTNETYTYKCTGTISNKKENGTCTKPEELTYTEKNKKEILNKIDTDYTDIEYIFDSIKDVKPTETKMSLTTTSYNYVIYINNYETDITITADQTDITQITINNIYMTYLINYTT